MRDHVPKLVGGVTALVALSAGILGQVDPLACVGRAMLAFLLGLVGYQVWYVLFTCRLTVAPAKVEAPRVEAQEAES